MTLGRVRVTQGVDADQLNISLLDTNDRQAGDVFQQELRIASPVTGALQWIAGAFYYDSSFERGGWDGHSSFVLGSEAPLVPWRLACRWVSREIPVICCPETIRNI